jgi:hypothetical protein
LLASPETFSFGLMACLAPGMLALLLLLVVVLLLP